MVCGLCVCMTGCDESFLRKSYEIGEEERSEPFAEQLIKSLLFFCVNEFTKEFSALFLVTFFTKRGKIR